MGKKPKVMVPNALANSPQSKDVAYRDRVILFYSDREGHLYREFSNFFRQRPYEFQIPHFACCDGLPSSVWCTFSEKAIMATKAALMGDFEMFHEIASADDPKSCKALGRGVRNFNEELWQSHLEEIAFEVVKQKFMAERDLRDLLLSTETAVLAEAAPNDCVWGIGLGKGDTRAKDPAQWRGRNVLGYALMKVRDHVRGNHTSAIFADTAPCGADDASALALEIPCAAGYAVTQSPALCSEIVLIDSASQEAATDAPSRPNKSRRWGRGSSIAADVDQSVPEALATPKVDGQKIGPSACVIEETCEKSTGHADNFPDCFVVLDFEATCEDGCQVKPQEIIEFPMVLVDARTGSQVAEFRSYVRPVHHPKLTDFCKSLTGIEQDDVDQAPTWSDALNNGLTWLDGELERFGFSSVLFVTCGDWDLRAMLPKQCALTGEHVPARFKQWMNIKNMFQQATGRPGKGMAGMLAALKLQLDGHHHCGLDDSRNIAKILSELLRRGAVIDDSSLTRADTGGGKSKGKTKGRSKR